MNHNSLIKTIRTLTVLVSVLLVVTISLVGAVLYLRQNPRAAWLQSEALKETVTPLPPIDPELIEAGIHVATGLKDDVGLNVVIANCTGCHSAKMITQNRATREGWTSMIRWMQATQNLWSMGENEAIVLDYLSKNYSPEKKGRRANLQTAEWYELEP